ncbi:MAG: arylsulfatase [Holophagales bacterium]|nr:arylsulfatase [Holophagales bacterium]MYG31149.1 arylsulfatase [Holophagales bacterium]MYI79418.1 arylsulfatase [Holophagales bacterium]
MRGATILLPAIVVASCAAPGPTARPNVVLFLADDQGWGDLSIHGNTNVRTPNLDTLAREGASFTRFFVSPVCSPTRAELLTGRYHPRTGVYATSRGGERLDLDETTIAQIFDAAGYATAAFGKWHNGTQPPYHPNARGFDEFYGFTSGHWGHYFDPSLDHNGRVVRGNGYVTDDFTDRAIRFIEDHRAESFFVWVAYNTPHSPMQVPDRWWGRFDESDLPQRHRDPEKERLDHTRAALAMTENIDWNVGRLAERLAELGLADDTIVVYLTDNGPNGWRWNGGMKGRKGSTDEGGVRSPFFVRWPRAIEAGTVVDRIAGAIDLLPTLADMAGIPPTTAKAVDGLSLKPLLLPGASSADLWPDRHLVSHWRGRTSVRSQRFRLDHDGRLFDMAADAGQRTDVAARHPAVAARLTEARSAFISEIVPELQDADGRPFPIGHPEHESTHLPARDATAHGAIERSSRYPNDSYFTNWTSPEDAITWDVEVLAGGRFEVVLYTTCSENDAGALIELRLGEQAVSGRIDQAHDPPLVGMEDDRVERIESYVKDFQPTVLGEIDLQPGRGTLFLRAPEIPGDRAMDFRLLILRRRPS